MFVNKSLLSSCGWKLQQRAKRQETDVMSFDKEGSQLLNDFVFAFFQAPIIMRIGITIAIITFKYSNMRYVLLT